MVPAHDPRAAHITDLEDVSAFDRLEIQHFFETYKDLEPGKSVEGAHWGWPRRGREGHQGGHRTGRQGRHDHRTLERPEALRSRRRPWC